MIIVSYDISDSRIRSKFVKMLTKNGAIRLQLSVYEVENTKRIIDNIRLKIKEFSRNFTAEDSIVIFEVQNDKLVKYGNAIHRDKNIIYL